MTSLGGKPARSCQDALRTSSWAGFWLLAVEGEGCRSAGDQARMTSGTNLLLSQKIGGETSSKESRGTPLGSWGCYGGATSRAPPEGTQCPEERGEQWPPAR